MFNLNRRRLKRRRRKTIKRVIRILTLIKKWEAKGKAKAAEDFNKFLDEFTDYESEYAGAARFVANNVEMS